MTMMKEEKEKDSSIQKEEGVDADHEKKLVLSYLSRIAAAARALTRTDKDDIHPTTETDNTADDCQSYIDQIACDLLLACGKDAMVSSVDHLPAQLPPLLDPHRDLPLDPSQIRTWKRADYLRNLLRAMPPIAMDTAAQIVNSIIVPMENNSKATSKNDIKHHKAAFLLFSIWLPIAPFLAPIVSELFALSTFPCPLRDMTNPKTTTGQAPQKQSQYMYYHFLLVQATQSICQFFYKRGEIHMALSFWNWSPVFAIMNHYFAQHPNPGVKSTNSARGEADDAMEIDDDDEDDDHSMDDVGTHNDKNDNQQNDLLLFDPNNFDLSQAIRWYIARIVTYVLQLTPLAKGEYLQRLNVRKQRVPWVIHPWIIDQEEQEAQELQLQGKARLFDHDGVFNVPSAALARTFITLHPWLVHVGNGIVFCKHQSIAHAVASKEPLQQSTTTTPVLTRTATTAENLALVGAAMSTHPHPPILICGPQGSGKSSLVRELATVFALTSNNDINNLLELHVDEETDAKTLIGTYTMTDIPGEFAWKPGALTMAVRTGKWVLVEDLDSVPIEIQASLVKLLEDRVLPLGMSGDNSMQRCHPNFRIFATLTTTATDGHYKRRGANKRVLNPSLWRRVFVRPLPYGELQEIARSRYPNLPPTISESALKILKSVDRSGRNDDYTGDRQQPFSEQNNPQQSTAASATLMSGRQPSVRDFFKLLSRIANGVVFERDTKYATESQRTLCMAESVDIFCAGSPHREQRRDFIRSIVAPNWGLTADLALAYIEYRRPVVAQAGRDLVEVGRVKLPVVVDASQTADGNDFTETSFSLRIMESIAVAVKENEPLLLVGETGGGKTSVVQHLAQRCGRDLVVQNLSLQTDSTDLLGGFRPLELQHVAQRVYSSFVDNFVATFSRKQNSDFLNFASSALIKKNWKKLSQCFLRASKMGLAKVRQQEHKGEDKGNASRRGGLLSWENFCETAESFERQRVACDSGLVFCFTEGALVDAIRGGKWVLLDEINLASSEILQRLLGLLDDRAGSLTLTERGDIVPVPRHPDFRLFAAMNPATDAGKKELHPSIRSRFTELYVDELLDPVELRVVASRYLRFVLPAGDKPPEHTDTVIASVDLYLKCRALAEQVLVDGAGHKPRFTLRTLSRALTAAKNLVSMQRISLQRALVEGFELAIQGPLDANSTKAVQRVLKGAFGDKIGKNEKDHPGRRPGKGDSSAYVLVKPFWIEAGPHRPIDWAEPDASGKCKFILTPSAKSNVRRLARAIASGPWPVLLEGPTSGGKTTLVEYVAARLGHHVVRINNHEHTDVQEYTGSFAPDANGALTFQDGILVRALKRGDWVILDELNLAPSEVLEALNRLLDDNRQLYLPEINQTITPHPRFRLFATQNPCGAYGGRKPLSRAFRNRFVELHVSDIPNSEMTTILERRCGCPPSHAKALVAVMDNLRQRRSKSGVFLGKDGLITPRDLLRWAERQASSKLQLAQDGYMLLAERLRTEEEKRVVREEIEKQIKLNLEVDDFYFGQQSVARLSLERFTAEQVGAFRRSKLMQSIAPTRSLLRSLTLIQRCVEYREPVLLVGDTGCGKTTVVELLSAMSNVILRIINCHATTETSDLIGGLRPVRGRNIIAGQIYKRLQTLLLRWPNKAAIEQADMPSFLRHENSDADDSDMDTTTRDGLKQPGLDLPEGAVAAMMKLTKDLKASLSTEGDVGIESPQKKPRLSAEKTSGGTSKRDGEALQFRRTFDELDELFRRHSALFEWADGPVAAAMKSGDMLLLDELSLTEDAVLERLNSVLEPSRTLVLAEKGEDLNMDFDSDSRVVQADGEFRIFATMNPGGDFGKRELSPALRSRFTEIWVPAVDDSRDVELVLARCLAAADREIHTKQIPQKMLEYVEWFNTSICKNPTSPYPGLSLSLRDVLSWAHFIIKAREANHDICVWEAYCHGAALMHLDGIHVGTGLGLHEAIQLKAGARDFLVTQVEASAEMNAFSADGSKLRFETKMGMFGVHPFWIPTGRSFVSKSSFNFQAPKTAENVHRVLRAMQVSKPILLEGDPGVGKTSLVLALSNAAGHRLTRINLSEQTDMSDLIGSDLPVPEKTVDGKMEASFKWCDGVLLTAIKNGDWVLLDELNLASQSVLEGLNSCLDYRAEIFVSELGKTFHCPPTFRIFAAQNPMAQGGGRKGLPRSFLNRFTKVHVSPLSGSDLRSIVESKYQRLTPELIDRMIDFNQQVHLSVVDERQFGGAGSPWEFNLRDVFRWADLVTSEEGPLPDKLAKFASFIYLQRFRNQIDRDKLRVVYSDIFGADLFIKADVKLDLDNTVVRIGCATLERIKVGKQMQFDPFRREPALLQSLSHPLEAVARCVQMQWPCLLVGKSSSGKSTIINGLAELCNAPLIQVSLSPSSEVNELVGCFEQTDVMAKDRQMLKTLRDIASAYCFEFANRDGYSHDVCELLYELNAASISPTCQNTLLSRNEPFRAKAVALADKLSKAAMAYPEFGTRHADKLTEAANHITNGCLAPAQESHFQWVDGVLARAMAEGRWLLLENVNLCPASVLDRLNPVMEIDGELLMAECGVQEHQNEEMHHRVVKAHPNFRVFLSMDPENGEISRAMRNRCIEIALLPPESTLFQPNERQNEDVPSGAAYIDCLDLCWNSGLRSSTLAEGILRSYGKTCIEAASMAVEAPSANALPEAAQFTSSLLAQGLTSEASIACLKGVFPLKDICLNDGWSKSSRMLPTPSLRCDHLPFPNRARVHREGRTLRTFVGRQQQLPSPDELFPGATDVFALSTPSDQFTDSMLLRNYLVFFYLLQNDPAETDELPSFLHGHPDSLVASFKFMADSFAVARSKLNPRFGAGVNEDASLDVDMVSSLARITQKLSERLWLSRMDTGLLERITFANLGVLDTSFLFNKGFFDRSNVPCKVTPAIFPLFQAFDLWTDLVTSRLAEANAENLQTWHRFHELLTERDRLWSLLAGSTFRATPNSLIPMDEAQFIVQWTWFKKRMTAFDRENSQHASDSTDAAERQVKSFIGTIDETVFGSQQHARHASPSIWRKITHPLIPCSAVQWEAIERLRELARLCCVQELPNDESNMVELRDLVKNRHPVLVFSQKEKMELLLALCMLHWSSTDEAAGELRVAAPRLSPDEVSQAFKKQWKSKEEEFYFKLESVRIDQSIETVENLLGVEDLKQLSQGPEPARVGSEFAGVSDRVLYGFGRLQLSSCAASFLVIEEMALIRAICRALLESSSLDNLWDAAVVLAEKVQFFIDEAMARTSWPVSELRPYQTFVWASKEPSFKKDGSIERLMTCLLPVMSSSALRHSMEWSTGRNPIIDARLEMPLLVDSELAGDDVRLLFANQVTSEETPMSHNWMQTQQLFHLLGKLFWSPGLVGKQAIYSTPENHRARALQARDFAQILASSSFQADRSDPFHINYVVAETFFALRKWMALDTRDDSVTKSNLHRMLQAGEFNRLWALACSCKHSLFQELLNPVVEPLLRTLGNGWKAATDPERRKEQTLAKIYTGLLRFHLLLPESPLDPAQRPRAKATLLTSQVSQLRAQVAAARLSSGYRYGDFSPNDPCIQKLEHEGALLATKISSQKKKIVERSNRAPPFLELYRELQVFATNFCRTETVSELISLVQDSETPHKARERSSHWLTNVSTGCERLCCYFGAYEDVVVPLVDAIRLMHEGVKKFVDLRLPRTKALPKQAPALQFFLRFPLGDTIDGFGDCHETMETARTAIKGGVRCHRTMGLALLSRLTILKQSHGQNSRTTKLCSAIFDSLVDPENVANEEIDSRSSSEQEERSFREQFPDHWKEFQGLLERTEQTNEEELEDESSTENTDLRAPIPPDMLEHLCFIHRQLFSHDKAVSDSDRCWALKQSLTAANHLVNKFGYPPCEADDHVGGAAHVMALSLAAPQNSNCLLRETGFGGGEATPIHFYCDPNPAEVLRAADVLDRLVCRITQLLTAFPGNELLVGLIKVADSVRKLDLHSSPIGKVMTGLEVVMKQAQDWEQHASDKVKIGKPLSDISHLVALWRKLELESWKDLLLSREDRCLKRARKHWLRIYQVLRSRLPFTTKNLSRDDTNSSIREPRGKNLELQWSPRWTWKGIAKCASQFFNIVVETPDSDFLELAKLMDTFVLTSPIGEFKERLQLLESFSSQLHQEAKSLNDSFTEHNQCARLLSSLRLFYEQFLPLATSKLEEQRAPVETKLRDQMKLAKWDEQSYYALADSSEKNHRNLMRCLREYDDILNLNMGQLLDRELCAGIRSESSSQDEASFTIPSQSTFFPLLSSVAAKESVAASNITALEKRQWVDPTKLGIQGGAHASNIKRYAAKMKVMAMNNSNHKGWSTIGRSIALEICEDIFHRIEALRSEKSSRQMKERALVDLFRAMKQHGYSNAKWSTPKEQKQMVSLFQVPSPRSLCAGFERQTVYIEEFEKYYLRHLAELKRFRSEAEVVGSKYMSRRETETMLNFSEHGLLMITQQRALLFSLLLDLNSLKAKFEGLAVDGDVLSSQATTKEQWLRASEKTCTAVENLQQLELLLRLSEAVLSTSKQKKWVSSTAETLKSHCNQLGDATLSLPALLTTKDIARVKDFHSSVEKAMSVCAICQDQNSSLRCVPKDAIDECYCHLKEAASALKGCMEACGELPMEYESSRSNDLVDSISNAVKATLLSVQETQVVLKCAEAASDDTSKEGDKEAVLWACHTNASKEWAKVGLKGLRKCLDVVLAKTDAFADMQQIPQLLSDLGAMGQMAYAVFEDRLHKYVQFCRDTAKFHYVLLRVFRVLVSKGYCSDETSSDDEEGGDGKGLSFEEKDGTGMGEGDGAQDVTDQLENEEQLLGLEGDNDKQEQNANKERQELNEEEAEKGMEMEGQFDGDMFDMPDKQETNDNDNSDDDQEEEEELDREMGLDEDPNEQVVDEKMWGDSDDEEDVDQGDEKFEKNSSMKGAQEEDQTRTREDEEGAPDDKHDDEGSPEQPRPDTADATAENDNASDCDVNEDFEDNYEENHGVDVREEPKNDPHNEEDDPMQLDDDLQLDGEDGEDQKDEEDAAAMNDAPDDNVEGGDDDNVEGEDDQGDMQQEEDNLAEEENDDNAQVSNAAVAIDAEETADDDAENPENQDPDQENPPLEAPPQPANDQAGLGIRAADGQDACQDTGAEEDEQPEETVGEDNDKEEAGGASEADQQQPSQGGTRGEGDNGEERGEDGEDSGESPAINEVPNPFKNPGDATRFWHEKLNMVDSQAPEEDEFNSGDNRVEDDQNPAGEYEYAPKDQDGATTQVLGAVAEDEAVELEQQDKTNRQDKGEEKQERQQEKANRSEPRSESRRQKSNQESKGPKKEEMKQEEEEEQPNAEETDGGLDNNETIKDDATEDEEGNDDDNDISMDDGEDVGNRVVSDMSRLDIEEELPSSSNLDAAIVEDEQVSGISSAEILESRKKWAQIHGETNSLALRLCEKLRLVMEPLVASKLKGDYRTGKRINMKRVIGYIASGYRKDKIWLKRTKPSKRNYRVLLAVDDSESMLKGGTGDVALRALATLAMGMSQLEIGELGVASFGDDMKLLHNFNQPFTSESGINVVQNFGFNQPRTRTALCVQSALSVLDEQSDSASVQLMFLISDGRIERDSRTTLRRLIREMMERNILLAMIIVEPDREKGEGKKNDSIVNMKEVTFEKGKPKMKRFIEDYPFPYYLILDDIRALPEVLGDALRQWFEMLAQQQEST
ncbi:Nuclear chaperone required for maturation and nuclear export of pre-60S ribosome subunits (By similarity) [Seminavis robusta]|uniref:Midasin n=1 Tax=Seminavis robusta TaxID=568900 RepID=A0A9N8HDD4_9STRA|nr:Nuclear chaperone required for maturation and nuclear export of pre-60S ribosome subunits (By similarity) [Seminavis robusta]|eukprot:Sro355_g125140.1 Nuclear chaperone required for maturation and nuclear export of pre-60S ribosome subunits (By similarity) (5715) ;mRNA; r:45227-62948